MKIRAVSEEIQPKVLALLRQTFAGSRYEVGLVEKLHSRNIQRLEWVCIHKGKVIAYIVFTNAYRGEEVCGLHLGPVAVKPEFQFQGVGSELISFALRQESIRSKTVYVLGEQSFYAKFGFTPCATPICPFDQSNRHFSALRNTCTTDFVVGYVKEFRS